MEKRSAETARNDSEQYRTLVNLIPGMVYEAGADGSVTVIYGCEDLCGYSLEEFISQKRTWTEIIHPYDRERIAEERTRLLEKPTSMVQEYRIISSDGSIRWVNDHKSSSFSPNGLFERITGIVFDNTRWKMGEVDLAESRNRFRAIFEQAAVGVAQMETGTGRFVRVNQRYCDLIGYTVDELTDLTFQDITHPDDLKTNLEKIKLLQAGVIRDFSMEKRYYRRDGSIVWVNLTVSPMWARGGTPDYHIAIVEDISRRKRIEEDLLIFSRAVEQSISSVMITDAKGVIEYVNPTFTRLSGYTAAEVIGGKPSISKSGKTPEEKYENLWQIITAGKEWQGELLNRRKDGQFYWVSASISPIKDSRGIITHFLAIQEEITQRKQIEETLFRQNTYLSALHEISLGILSRLNLDELLQTLIDRAGQLLHTKNGFIYLVNHRTHEIECRFGSGVYNEFTGISLKPGEGVAGRVWNTVRPLIIEDYQTWEGRSDQIQDTSIRSVIGVPLVLGSQAIGVLVLAFDYESDGVFDDYVVDLLGRLANLASIGIENVRLFDESQRAVRTEQRRAAELTIIVTVGEMVANNLDLQSLTRTIGDKITEIFEADAASILLLDPQTRMIHSLYEYDQGQHIENIEPFPLGQGLTSEVIRSRQPLLINTADEAAHYGAYYPPEAQAENPSVTQSYLGVPILVGDKTLGVIAVHSYSQYVFDENSTHLLSALSNSIGSSIETARLYTEMQQAREEAETANTAKSIFLASISHELRTPLNAILGFAQLLRKDSNLTPDQQEYLEIINRSGVNLLALINDVLEISKIESGRAVQNVNDIDLYQLFAGLIEVYALQAREKGLVLSFDYSEDTPQYVRTDNVKLWHILSNLIGNAIKFTSSGGVSVRVRSLHSSADVETIQFEVEDTGPGIAPEEMDDIFDPFVQASLGKQNLEGVGLGLSICKRYVRLLGGDIKLKSQLGIGSIFEFMIQVQKIDGVGCDTLKPARRVVGVNSNQLAPHGGKFRLLIAEDDDTNRLLLAKALIPLGFEVQEAGNGQEAFELWKRWQPDLIFMDMHMPVLDGFAGTKQIRDAAEGSSPIIIALTAASFEEDREQALAAGCDDFVRKPFQLDEIYNMLSQHLGVALVYQEPQGLDLDNSLSAASPRTAGLESLDISGVSETLWSELRQATVSADIDQIFKVIAMIKDQNPLAARYLENQARNFDYRRILAVIELVDKKKESGKTSL
jgi:two-component system sensor histidine kinase/response regulator